MAETQVKTTCEDMVAMVTEKFIVGKDANYLKKVEKTAKGGGILNSSGKALVSEDKNCIFSVMQPLIPFMKNKDVTFANVSDKQNKMVYIMTPKTDWPKFYEAIKDAIAKEIGK